MTDSFKLSDVLDAMRNALTKAGLAPEQIIADGNLHRCPTIGKPRGRDGAYVAHLDNPASIWFQNFRTGISDTWSCRNGDMSQAERETLRQRADQARAMRESERCRQHEKAAARAADILAKSKEPDASHSYLVRKEVFAHEGIRQHGKALVVPIRDADDTVTSLQFIQPDGSKRFLPGGKITGGHFQIKGAKPGPILICEGYATGASLALATDLDVLVALNAGNLEPVAKLARAQHPHRDIVVCADNDTQTEGNPGVTAATKAALAVGGKLAVAVMPDGAKGDFNDIAVTLGPEAVKAQVAAATAPIAENQNSVSLAPVQFFSAADLEHKQLPPLTWVVPGILPVGLAWLVGAMKAGKSHFVLDMLVAVATGGKFLDAECPEAEALYLDLEGSHRRMQQRIHEHRAAFPRGLTYALDFPRMDRGFCEAMESFLDGHPGCRIVAVDVFARVNSMMPKGADTYQWQYDILATMKKVAERRNVCLLLLHHANKGSFTDTLNSVHGSVANTAAADTILMLRRQRGSKTGHLDIHGRDVAERTIVMEAGEGFTWRYVGEEGDVGVSMERKTILEYLESCPGDDFTPGELARELDRRPGNIRKMLHSMTKDGQVMRKKTRSGYRYSSFQGAAW